VGRRHGGAVNDAITDKKIIITMDTETVDNRYSVKVGKSIEVLMQQDKICYEYPYSDAPSPPPSRRLCRRGECL
jgi:hypothetical protein